MLIPRFSLLEVVPVYEFSPFTWGSSKRFMIDYMQERRRICESHHGSRVLPPAFETEDLQHTQDQPAAKELR